MSGPMGGFGFCQVIIIVLLAITSPIWGPFWLIKIGVEATIDHIKNRKK